MMQLLLFLRVQNNAAKEEGSDEVLDTLKGDGSLCGTSVESI